MEHRPRYHNERDKAAERKIADEIQEAWHCHCQLLSEWAYRFDFAVSHGWRKGLIGYAEVKNRPNLTFGKNSGYEIAAHKLAFGRLLIEQSETKIGTWVFIRPSDGIVYWAEIGEPVKFILGGRRDRDNPYDIEPMGIIPWSRFETLTTRHG